jgi:hypothetical protein
MNRCYALLATAIVFHGAAACRAGDDTYKVMMLPQTKESATAQPGATLLPQPKVEAQPGTTLLPPPKVEARPENLPAPQRLTPAPAPAPVAAAPCCGCGPSKGCCQRFIEWLTYQPLTRCGPCGCLPCPVYCCDPPLYLYFLTDCANGGGPAHWMTVSAHDVPAAGCQTCEKKHTFGGLLTMPFCKQCNHGADVAAPADPH